MLGEMFDLFDRAFIKFMTSNLRLTLSSFLTFLLYVNILFNVKAAELP